MARACWLELEGLGPGQCLDHISSSQGWYLAHVYPLLCPPPGWWSLMTLTGLLFWKCLFWVIVRQQAGWVDD